jgi:hypothetical protein
MQGKITLITAPDFFENDNPSILFMHLDAIEQDNISVWLKNSKIDQNVNFYVYSGEEDIPWLFYALGHCKHKYINIDCYTEITKALVGYILGNGTTHYKTSDDKLARIYSHINHNRITTIEQFLENAFSDNNNSKSSL